MISFPFSYLNGGLFLSRGTGRHSVRTISSNELILVVSGTLDMFEEDKNYHLSAGDFLILRKGKQHGGTAPYPGALKFYWHHFLPASEEAQKFLDSYSSTGFSFWQDSIFQLSGQLLTEQQRKEECPGKQMLLDALFSGLMTDLQNKPKQTQKKRNPLAEKAKQFFLLHFAEPVSTSDAADALGCSPDYLGRVFQQTYGHSIGEELRICRIRQAKNLLRMSKMTLKETADLCGYSDLSYFHRQFFRETGMAPGAWKRITGIGHVNTD